MSSVSISMLDESISIPPSNIQTKKVSSNNIWSQIINSFSASRLLIAATIAGLIIVTGVLITSLLSQSIMNDLYHDIETVFTLASASAPFFNAWSGMIPSAAPQITRTFTVYTITNANDILQGAKPNIQELPPITYIVYQEKRSPLWDQDQFYDTVRYTPYTSYTFADNTSAQVANTLVTTINLPLLMAVTFPIVAYIIATTPILAARYLDNEQALFIQRPAHEVIFGWKNDPFFNDFNTHKPFWSFSLPTNVDGFFQNDTTLNEAIKYHHTIRMNTGIVNPAKISYMEAWNGDSNLICCAFGDCNAKDSAGSISALPWNDGYANTIDGSDGSLFLDRVDCSQQLLLGAYDFGIFRHVNLECNTAPQNIPPIPVNYTTYIQSTDKPGENKKNRNSSDEDDDANFSPNYSINGISVLSFQLTISSFQNATTNPDIGTSYFQYGPNGLMNLSMCYNGIPIFFSKPRYVGCYIYIYL